MQKLAEIYKQTTIDCWDKEAVADYGTDLCYSFGELAKKIAEIHILFDINSIKKGDKVAVLGKNSSHWLATFIATINYGAVIVPILDEFNSKDVVHILNHSDSQIFFCDNWFKNKFSPNETPNIKSIIALNDFSLVHTYCDKEAKNKMAKVNLVFSEKYPNGFTKENVEIADISGDDVIVLNYTSGTTSFTKGVMIMEKNIVGNITFFNERLSNHSDRTLSILPAAHIYGLIFGVLAYTYYGGKVTFLGKIPSPAILLAACAEVKPNILTLVPLIFEKIYKMRIRPKLEKPLMKMICKVPFIKKIIYKKIGKKLYQQLGGEGLYQVIIGGAAINKDVEKFLQEIKFPFTVGYGMTECAPLISYIDHTKFILESVGLELGKPYATTRIVNENNQDEFGEIQVLGSNVMKGYYKDEEATKSTFTEDGWLKTGDLGYIDNKGNIFIKGRSKTMILGPSGENIYPEAIESKILNLPFVLECIVLQNKDNKLVAFVYPDLNMLKAAGVPSDKIDRMMANNRRTVNDQLARFENIHRIEILEAPLAKTPKNTVKRYGLEYLLEFHEKKKKLSIEKKREELAIVVQKEKNDKKQAKIDKRNSKKKKKSNKK